MTLYDKHLEAIDDSKEWKPIGPFGDHIVNEHVASLACERITLDEMEKMLEWLRDSSYDFGSKLGHYIDVSKDCAPDQDSNYILIKDLIKAYYARDKEVPKV